MRAELGQVKTAANGAAPRVARRQFLRAGVALTAGALVPGLTGCRTRQIEIPKIIEKEVIKVVTQIVQQTVIVAATAEAEPPEPASEATPTTPAPEPPTSITIDGMRHGWHAFAQRMAPTFQELFPRTRLTWRSVTPWPQFAQRLAALAAAGDLGDLVEAPLGTPIRRWADDQIITPLDDLIEDEGYDLQGVFAAALDQASHKGSLYGVPLVAHPGDCLILVNSEKVAPEQALENGALREDLSELSQLDDLAAGWAYLDDVSMPAAWSLLGAFGARWLNQWGTQSTLQTSPSERALEWAATVRRQGLAPPLGHAAHPPETLYARGELAILRTSFAKLWLLKRTDRLPESTVAGLIGSYGEAEAVAPSGEVVGVAYCMTPSCQAPELALQWIKFMTTREMGVQMLLGGYGPPGARLTAWHDPRVLDYMPACAPLGERCAALTTQPLPWNLATSACFVAWNQRIDALWDAETPVNELASELSRAITEILSLPSDQTSL